MPVDSISLEVFKNMFISVAEEMGVALLHTAYSPNMKERRDFSCAVFNPQGEIVSQAAHVPVHLGSMPASVQTALDVFPGALRPGDIVIINDPYLGGTHLPDITLVAPVYLKIPPSPFKKGGDGGILDEGGDSGISDKGADKRNSQRLVGFVANRGHHSDVGGMTPGSMPLSTELYQEGRIIPPIKLARGGRLNHEVIQLIGRNSCTPDERKGDLSAQIASIRVGEKRLQEVAQRYGLDVSLEHMDTVLDYSERITRQAIRRVPDGATGCWTTWTTTVLPANWFLLLSPSPWPMTS